MARKNAKQVESIHLQNSKGEQVMVWKATIPLSVEEHAQLATKLQMEQERSGVKIILVPYSVDVDMAGDGWRPDGADGNPESGAAQEADKEPVGESGG
jgi:hypothetical protein